MRRLNIADPTFAYDAEDPDGFRAGMLRFGKLVGAGETGISVYELPGPVDLPVPLRVRRGRVAARPPWRADPANAGRQGAARAVGRRLLSEGPEGAHGVRNETGETVRVLMFSTVTHPAATVYPDSDKIAIWTGNPDDDLMVQKTSGVGYYTGET